MCRDLTRLNLIVGREVNDHWTLTPNRTAHRSAVPLAQGGKAKPTKHTSKELKNKEKAATQNKGGGKHGAADRKGGKAGHAKFECYICMVRRAEWTGDQAPSVLRRTRAARKGWPPSLRRRPWTASQWYPNTC